MMFIGDGDDGVDSVTHVSEHRDDVGDGVVDGVMSSVTGVIAVIRDAMMLSTLSDVMDGVDVVARSV